MQLLVLILLLAKVVTHRHHHCLTATHIFPLFLTTPFGVTLLFSFGFKKKNRVYKYPASARTIGGLLLT